MARKQSTFKKPLMIIGLLILGAVVMSACGSGSVLQGSSWPGMTLKDGILYIANEEFVYAISEENGSEIWRYPQESERNTTFFAPPAVASEDLIIVGSYDTKTYALQPTGRSAVALWTFQAEMEIEQDRIIGGPIVDMETDTVYVPGSNWNLYALNLEDGGPGPWLKPFRGEEAFWSAPLIVGERIYASSLDQHLYALELDSGRMIWSKDLGGAITDTPTLAGKALLSGTFAQSLFALNLESGNEMWSFQADGGIWGSPAVSDSMAFFGDDAGFAYALDFTSGSLLWKEQLEGPVRASPIVIDEVVYFVTEFGAVQALDTSTGNSLWPGVTTIDGRLLSDPIASEGGLLVGAMESDCLVFILDYESGFSRCFFATEN